MHESRVRIDRCVYNDFGQKHVAVRIARNRKLYIKTFPWGRRPMADAIRDALAYREQLLAQLDGHPVISGKRPASQLLLWIKKRREDQLTNSGE